MDSKKVWEDMTGEIGQGVDNFTLLYCMSATPADTKADLDNNERSD